MSLFIPFERYANVVAYDTFILIKKANTPVL